MLLIDVGSAVALAMIVHIPNSYFSLGLLVGMWALSIWVVRVDWSG